MKKISEIYKPHMIRPIIYKTITRFGIGLIFALLWDRYLNVRKLFSMVDYAFFFVGFIYFALAWFNYLKMDGVKFHFPTKQNKKKRPRSKMKMLIDYTDQDIDPMDMIDEKEEMMVIFASNIITGLCFMIPSILAVFF
ncbi:hypothetical protein [Anaeropeptidivorans aminofermentans]|uniref:hypothetical protein n=1 Tax=Anaeropeptidivorans aminofermentans TaxID=2934315 RepID=UPI0020257ABF|nr:hypothetical protein [Anaeropeptidivorans aminofermentans]